MSKASQKMCGSAVSVYKRIIIKLSQQIRTVCRTQNEEHIIAPDEKRSGYYAGSVNGTFCQSYDAFGHCARQRVQSSPKLM